MIYLEEMFRMGYVGLAMSVTIITMGLPPVLRQGPEAMKKRICPAVS